jgi:XTP/dITP diphosphohydrolase
MIGSTLLIASHNKGKVREIGELLAPLGLQVKSAAELNIVEPEETGDTFVANAQLKAHHCAKASNLPSLSDDSGLVIPAIGGDPGIYSARWAGEAKDFSVAFTRIQSELKEVDALPPVAAYFVCVLCLAFPDGRAFDFEGRIDGTLTFPPRGEKGFGYDPIFIPNGYDVTFAELDPNMKTRISHRAKAFDLFLAFLHANQ